MITAPTREVTPRPEKRVVRDYLSFSAISTFQACPLRYYFLCG